MDPLARNLRRVTGAVLFVIVMVVVLFALQVQRVDHEHQRTDQVVQSLKTVVASQKTVIRRLDVDRARSDAAACAAVNSTADGVGKLVAQLTKSTATSSQRTPAQKAATERFYHLALADFPRCTSSVPLKVSP